MNKNYKTQAKNFLKKTDTKMTVKFTEKGLYFLGDTHSRDIYKIGLKRYGKWHYFKFGQSLQNSNGKTPPNAYDILACLTKYDVGSFEDFCSEFGYDTDSRTAEKTYKTVLKEYKMVAELWNDAEIKKLSEIQ